MDVDLSERIRRWRESREVTKTELAHRVGVSLEAVIQWENGTTQPKHTNIEKIAEALGLTVPGFWGEAPQLKKQSRAS